MKIKTRYRLNKSAKVGDQIICPSCGTHFTKAQHQQAFCKTKGGTICKDKYWNTVTPDKKNNRTRISPASAAWTASRNSEIDCFGNYRIYENDHPFSSEALGQE